MVGKCVRWMYALVQPVSREVWNYQVHDVIERVPPHWNEGVIEERGSRWAGQVRCSPYITVPWGCNIGWSLFGGVMIDSMPPAGHHHGQHGGRECSSSHYPWSRNAV